MKIFIYLFLFFNFSILFADDLPFTYESLRNDFNGVTYNSKAILAYGTSSAIVRSFDRGVSWDQVSLAQDSLTIMRIRNINDTFYGVLDKNLIIKSIDDGKSWLVKDLGQGPDIWDFDYSGDLLYVLKTGEIDVYDLDLKLKRNITYDTTYHPIEIHIFKNYIYIPLDSGKMATYDIDNDFKSGIIDFKEAGLCTDCLRISRIRDNGSELFASMSTKVFKSGDMGTSWQLINTNFLVYNICNNNIYDMKQEKYTNYYTASRLSLFKMNNDSLQRITEDIMPKRFTTFMMPTDYDFIGNDTVIVVGRDKLISMSFDGGQTWKLKSHLRGFLGSMFWINELTCYQYFGHFFKQYFGHFFK